MIGKCSRLHKPRQIRGRSNANGVGRLHFSWMGPDQSKGQNLEAFDRSIDVHISRIRAEIESDPKHPRRVLTVRGAGYVFARAQD